MLQIRQQKIRQSMKFADRVRTRDDRNGTIFEFWDATKLHGQYQVGNPFSPAPVNTIGAVKEHDGWHWIIREPIPVCPAEPFEMP